jgi:hypothetical protein
LFADAGSVTPKSNPFNTDANGYGSFYVTDGRYRIQATDIDWRDTDIFISPTFYAQLAGGPLANFTAMPQVGGDPIVESGSNSDGEWTRWSDGTISIRCVVSLTSNRPAMDDNYENLPTFIIRSSSSVILGFDGGSGSPFVFDGMSTMSGAVTSTTTFQWRVNFTHSQAYSGYAHILGRWK